MRDDMTESQKLVACQKNKCDLFLGHLHLGIVLVSLLSFLFLLLSFASIWVICISHLVSTWGRLIHAYSNAVDKLDVARGRRIPAPPFKVLL